MILAGLIETPDVVSKETGLTDEQLRALPRANEEYIRYFVEARNNSSKLEYNYVQTTGAFNILHQYEFKPLEIYANYLFQVTSSITLAKNGVPIYRSSAEGGPAKDCSLSWSRITTHRLEQDPTDPSQLLVSKKTITDHETKDEEAKLSKTLVHDTFTLDMLNSDENLKFISERGRIETYLWNDGSTMVATIDKSSGPSRFYNPITKRLESSPFTWRMSLVWPNLPPLEYKVAKGENGFHLGTLSYQNTTTNLEFLNKELWMEIKFPARVQRYWAWTWGFRNSDLKIDPLVYVVDAPEFYKYYPNYGVYFGITNPVRKNGNFTFEVIANSYTAPKSLPWLGTEKSGTGPNLDSTVNVDLNDVKEIADSMRPSLKGMNRLQVSRAIIRKIQELIITTLSQRITAPSAF